MTTTERLTTAVADRYRIERALGAGGMATVYLAEDLKHKRKVALKVLRPELAAVLGAERFVQEIKTTAQLQHPHILPLFDSGEADGFLFYVMPYIEGETLRDKLNRDKQLGIDEAIRITREVADALHYAHTRGVIHRDIKPENILLHAGRPMVADFGIALAVSAAAGGRMTETGLSLGTPHYMSPEQATADRDITARSDVYSLASVLYEMLGGEPPHMGNSAQQIIMKIVAEDAQPVTRLRKAVPAHVADALAVALEKLPADRFETAEAFALALTGAHATRPGRQATGRVTPDPRWSERPARKILLGAGLLVVGAVVGGLWRSDEAQPALPVARFTIPVPGGHDLVEFAPNVAVGRDGRTIAYISRDTLFRRDLDRDAAVPMATSPGICCPAFSPDGRWILLGLDGLSGVDADGGAVIDLGDRALSADLLVGSFSTGVRRRRAGQTNWETITGMDSTGAESAHRWPQLLAGGRRLLFTILGPDMMWHGASVVLMDVESGRRVTLVRGATQGVYIPTGHLIYVRADGSLEAVAVDLERMETTGSPVIMEEGVRTAYWGGAGSFAVSENGTLVFVRGSQWANHQLTWVNRRGEVIGRVGRPVTVEGVRLSPDGRSAVTYVASANADIARFDLATGEPHRLTFDPQTEDAPIWSPDGRRVAYRKVVAGRDHRVVAQTIDRQGELEELLRDSASVQPVSWSPDDSAMLVRSGNHLVLLHLDGGTVDALPGTGGRTARFSPDGRWIAYESTETGRREVYVVRYPELTGQRQLSLRGGMAPEWSAGSGELFFVSDTTLMVARVSSGVELEWATPRALFSLPDLMTTSVGFGVSRDGQRFLYPAANPDALAREIHVVVNWFDELRQRMGGETP